MVLKLPTFLPPDLLNLQDSLDFAQKSADDIFKFTSDSQLAHLPDLFARSVGDRFGDFGSAIGSTPAAAAPTEEPMPSGSTMPPPVSSLGTTGTSAAPASTLPQPVEMPPSVTTAEIEARDRPPELPASYGDSVDVGTSGAAPTIARGAPAATPTASAGAPAAGEIDNSSRASFARTAYPYALRSAGGDPELANRLIASAISENGTVGSGKPIGVGFNFGGIKYDPEASGSGNYATWESEGGQRVNQTAGFAHYDSPQAGFDAIPRFLQKNFPKQWAAYQQSHDAAQLYRDINAAGYATDQSWHAAIESINARDVAPNTGSLAAQAPTATTPTQRASEARAQSGETSDVDQAALDDPDKWALCGPVAATIAAQRYGPNWTVAQAKKIAVENGLWDSGNGMHGLESQVTLLKKMGIGAASGPAEQAHLAADAQAGNTPIISTNRHYFILKGYDPSTGKFDTTTTGSVLKGGSRWLTLDQIAALGGGIQGAAYIDNPSSPTPSSVASAPPNAAVPPPTAAPPPAPPAAPPPAGGASPTMMRMGLTQPLDQSPEDPDAGPHETGYRLPPGTPIPIQNEDGSVSTELSITVTDPRLNGGRPTNIPSIWGGMRQSEDDAVDYAVRSGRPWPSYNSIKQAEQAARLRSASLGAGAPSVGGAVVPSPSDEMPKVPADETPVRDRWASDPNGYGAPDAGGTILPNGRVAPRFPLDVRQPGERPYDVTDREGVDVTTTNRRAPGQPGGFDYGPVPELRDNVTNPVAFPDDAMYRQSLGEAPVRDRWADEPGRRPYTPGNLHPNVARAFRAANGRDPTPAEAAELRQALGLR